MARYSDVTQSSYVLQQCEKACYEAQHAFLLSRLPPPCSTETVAEMDARHTRELEEVNARIKAERVEKFADVSAVEKCERTAAFLAPALAKDMLEYGMNSFECNALTRYAPIAPEIESEKFRAFWRDRRWGEHMAYAEHTEYDPPGMR